MVSEQTLSAAPIIISDTFRTGIDGFLFSWQALIGAFIGAATPLLIWFFIEWKKRALMENQDLVFIEKYLSYACNHVFDIKKELQDFITKRLNPTIENVKNTPVGMYSLDVTFFPSVNYIIDEKILRIQTKSNYLENELLDLMRKLSDYKRGILEMGAQFEHMIKTNQDIVYQKLNDPDAQKHLYARSLVDFRDEIQQNIIDKNSHYMIKRLMSAAKATYCFRTKKGLWKNTFSDKGCPQEIEKKIREYFDRIAEQKITEYYQQSVH